MKQGSGLHADKSVSLLRFKPSSAQWTENHSDI